MPLSDDQERRRAIRKTIIDKMSPNSSIVIDSALLAYDSALFGSEGVAPDPDEPADDDAAVRELASVLEINGNTGKMSLMWEPAKRAIAAGYRRPVDTRPTRGELDALAGVSKGYRTHPMSPVGAFIDAMINANLAREDLTPDQSAAPDDDAAVRLSDEQTCLFLIDHLINKVRANDVIGNLYVTMWGDKHKDQIAAADAEVQRLKNKIAAGYRRPVDTRPTRSQLRICWDSENDSNPILTDWAIDRMIDAGLAVEDSTHDPAPAAEVPKPWMPSWFHVKELENLGMSQDQAWNALKSIHDNPEWAGIEAAALTNATEAANGGRDAD